MKKRGFTIAEILITLGIIGIVSALTLPTFTANSRNLANATKLSAIISSVENAFASMMVSESAHDMNETNFVIDGPDDFYKNLGKYLKLSGESTVLTDYYESNNPFETIDGEPKLIGFNKILQTKNGALLFYRFSGTQVDNYEDLGGSVGESIAALFVDVNGGEKPNIWGRDVFLFLIGSDGILYPAGSRTFSILHSGIADETWKESGFWLFACHDGLKGAGCTARLVENNFVIDY